MVGPHGAAEGRHFISYMSSALYSTFTREGSETRV